MRGGPFPSPSTKVPGYFLSVPPGRRASPISSESHLPGLILPGRALIIIAMKWKGLKWTAAAAGFGLGIVYSLYLGCWGM
jgi:hypothetical protein